MNCIILTTHRTVHLKKVNFTGCELCVDKFNFQNIVVHCFNGPDVAAYLNTKRIQHPCPSLQMLLFNLFFKAEKLFEDFFVNKLC